MSSHRRRIRLQLVTTPAAHPNPSSSATNTNMPIGDVIAAIPFS